MPPPRNSCTAGAASRKGFSRPSAGREFPSERLVGTLSGKAALHQFKKGDLVAVSLNYRGYKKVGDFVNHIFISDIKLVSDLDYLYL